MFLERNKMSIHTKKIIYYSAQLILAFLTPQLLFRLLEGSFLDFNYNFVDDFINLNPEIYKFSYLILFLIVLWFSSILGDIISGSIITSTIMIAIAYANAQKMHSRNFPLVPEELSMISEVKSLIKMVNLSQLLLIGLGILFLTGLTFFIKYYFSFKLKITFKSKWVFLFRTISLCFLSISLYSIIQISNPDSAAGKYAQKKGIEFLEWNQNVNFINNGFVLGFTYNINSYAMEKPENYNRKNIEKIVTKYKKQTAKKKDTALDVNVIYIMNESFTNPAKSSNIYQYGENPIPYISEILENYPSGQTLVGEYGGGTANIEFEALTSFSTYFTKGTPYQNSVSKVKDFPSIVSYFNDLDYQTTALHPYFKTMYKRDLVYQNYGFDNFYGIDEMEHVGIISPSLHVNDGEAYKDVLKQLNSNEKNQFILLITMQNHIPYDPDYLSNEFYIENDTIDQEKKQAMSAYLGSLNLSDQSFYELTLELSKIEKKTAVVFWGDHYPGSDIYKDLFEVDQQQVHQTPLFYWTNYQEKDSELGTISPNQITNNLLDIIDYPKTPFLTMINELEKTIPALTKEIHLDSNNHIIGPSELNSKVMEDYRLIQYDILLGKNYSKKLNFFELLN